jgi:hypothetical protein
MPPTTVTVLDDERLIRDGEAAVERWSKARTEIMPMAFGLAAAKRKYPATQDFGEWLRESPYNILNHTDRAALLKIAEHADFATTFLPTTDLLSPRLIWDAMAHELEMQEILARPPSMPSSHDVNSTEIDADDSSNEAADDNEDDEDDPDQTGDDADTTDADEEEDDLATNVRVFLGMLKGMLEWKVIKQVRAKGDPNVRTMFANSLRQCGTDFIRVADELNPARRGRS